MKFFNVKTAIAAVCVVAASFGGMKAYNNVNQSEADLLLAENVEALSWDEGDAIDACITRACPIYNPNTYCEFYCPNYGVACFWQKV